MASGSATAGGNDMGEGEAGMKCEQTTNTGYCKNLAKYSLLPSEDAHHASAELCGLHLRFLLMQAEKKGLRIYYTRRRRGSRDE
jgi:hypothetical protein